ncbi:MAG: SH3 domain-containing protein [Actinomycetia bacterium]|nr:SH3 domain-containing protein [Actinomycetes bacterium]
MEDGVGDTGWQPTHMAPAGGLAAWPYPDPAVPPTLTLPGGTQLRVLAETTGWANVVARDGWEGWVDASLLIEPEHSAASSSDAVGAPVGADVPVTDKVAGFLGGLEKPGMGALLGLLAVVSTILMSVVLWPVLKLPGDLISGVLPEGDCTRETPKTWGMYVCSAKIGFLQALGGIISLVVVIALRRPIQSQLRKILPKGGSSLAIPLLTTVLFGVFYASTHADTSSESGLVSQRMFPAVIGLLTFAGMRFGPALARRFGGAIGKRNRIPGVFRGLLAVGLPMILAYVSMNQERVSDTARKEQLVVLATMLFGYVAFLPMNGDITSVTNRLFSALRRWISRLRRERSSEPPPDNTRPPQNPPPGNPPSWSSPS